MSHARYLSRCLDVSMERTKVALVDEHGGVAVYALAEGATARLLWSGQGASSCAWNAALDDLLAYSGEGFLCTKAAGGHVHRQPMQVPPPHADPFLAPSAAAGTGRRAAAGMQRSGHPQLCSVS